MCQEAQIAAADLLCRRVSRSQRGYNLLVLRDVLQLHAPSCLDHRRRLHGALQHRFDFDLVPHHRTYGSVYGGSAD
jgi:hypothetical protein